jgi:hypothetical protein
MGMIRTLIIFVFTLPRMLNFRVGMGLIVEGLYASLYPQKMALALQRVQVVHLLWINVLNMLIRSQVIRVIVQMGTIRLVFVALGIVTGLLIV